MKHCLALTLILSLILSLFSGCGAPQAAADLNLRHTGSMALEYADRFAVDYYEGGYKLITIADGSRYLTVPEGMEVPDQLPSDIRPLYQPLDRIYLAATASMCLFDGLNAMDAIRLSGTRVDGWYVENARRAMEEGRILFAGKYNEPDYELMLSENCSLAIESTMIGHASDVRAKLEELGIPVLVDHSSLEKQPLGRTEWIKLYGALLNKEAEADALFAEQADCLQAVAGEEPTGKTVVFFHISTSGRVVARKTGDYVSRMIELAGGEYVFKDLGDPEKDNSTVTMEMETFFATAKDADYILYNSTIGGQVNSLEELLAKSQLLSQFRAVQNGNVWCTDQNMFQQTTQLGRMIQSFHEIFSGQAEALDSVPFLYRLK